MILMGKILLRFYGTKKSKSNNSCIYISSDDDELLIGISNDESGDSDFISLDKHSAVKLVKEIRKEIAKLNHCHGRD